MRMGMLLYATDSGKASQRLLARIEGLVAKEKLEKYETIDVLTQRLRKPRGDMEIAVLLAADRQDLLEMLCIRDLLDNMRTILILPDKSDDTIAKGHNLRPRYVSFVDSDFEDIAAVLGKMLGNGHEVGNK